MVPKKPKIVKMRGRGKMGNKESKREGRGMQSREDTWVEGAGVNVDEAMIHLGRRQVLVPEQGAESGLRADQVIVPVWLRRLHHRSEHLRHAVRVKVSKSVRERRENNKGGPANETGGR